MQLKIQGRHFEVAGSLRRLIERQSSKAQKILPTFAGADLDLHVTLERLPRGNQYHTVLVLTTPQNAIRVEELENSPTASVLRSFEELLRRIKKFKSQLNRERFWQKKQGIAEVRTERETSRELEGAINQSLAKVENYIRRELFHRATLNEIPAGFLQPQALLDEVFLEVSSHSDVRPENIPLEQWMLQVARRTIRQRMEALEEDQKQPHIEETAADPSRWEDEDLHFHQPDEVLRLQDLLRSEQSASPEQLLQREEAQEKLQKDIARLPESLRESFVLFVLEGLNSDEIAMITGKDPTVVLEDVKKARHRLRQREAN